MTRSFSSAVNLAVSWSTYRGRKGTADAGDVLSPSLFLCARPLHCLFVLTQPYAAKQFNPNRSTSFFFFFSFYYVDNIWQQTKQKKVWREKNRMTEGSHGKGPEAGRGGAGRGQRTQGEGGRVAQLRETPHVAKGGGA